MLDLAFFFVALAGFIALYGLERLAVAQGTREVTARPGVSPSVQTLESAAVYWLHLALFMVYNLLITYTMVLRVRKAGFSRSCSPWPWGFTS